LQGITRQKKASYRRKRGRPRYQAQGWTITRHVH